MVPVGTLRKIYKKIFFSGFSKKRRKKLWVLPHKNEIIFGSEYPQCGYRLDLTIRFIIILILNDL